jgi:hypothetical protein
MPAISNSTTVSVNACVTNTFKPCIATPPKAVWVSEATAHGGDCAIKAWLMQKCAGDVLVQFYESDLNDAPSGSALAGNFNDWMPAVPPTKVMICPVAKQKYDREFFILCAPDGTKVITQNVTEDDAPLGTPPKIEAWTMAGVPYTGSVAALTDCGAEKVDLADSESYCAAGANHSRIDIVDVTTKAIIGTLWLNDAGTVVAAPVGAVKGTCEQIASNTAIITQLTAINTNTDSVEALITQSNVQLTAINANTDTLEPLITATNVLLTALLAEQDKELSFTTPVRICVGGVAYLVRQRSVYDSEAAASVSLVAEYTTDGVTWTMTAPTGSITLGECPKCEVAKQFEFLNYRTPETTGLQPKVLGLHQGIDSVDFNQSMAGDFEFYLVVDGAAQLGNAAGAGYGAQYPLQFPTLQSIADWLNVHPANTAPKDTWVVAGLAGAQSLVIQGTVNGVAPNHVWADMVLAHYVSAGSIDYNFFKTSPNSIDVEMVVPAQCRTIEVLKEVDCNRSIQLFGFELDGTAISPFDPKNLRSGVAKELRRSICVTMNPVAPATVGETWNLEEVTSTIACGDTTVKYFDPDKSPMTEVDAALIKCINSDGKCPCATGTTTATSTVTNKIYLTKNAGVLTVADIIAATSAKHIHSITVKQSLGNGSVTGDVGGAVPLQTAETWHWDIISQGQTEFLDTSLLSMNANGGEQRITAIYTI